LDKHLDEFPGVSSPDELAKVVDDVVKNGVKRPLRNGRTAFFKDGTLVLRDPNDFDGGTVYRPTDGFDAFLKLQ
jgi:hypothetical protein